MSKSTYPMTKYSYGKLKQELITLETEQRASATKRVNHARSFCDFREDSEYEAALENRATIEARISELQQMIQHAEIIVSTAHETVQIGSTVTVKDIANDFKETYRIVDPEEADPSNGKISYNAPIAKQLSDAKVDDTITLETPAGNRHVKIVDIR